MRPDISDDKPAAEPRAVVIGQGMNAWERQQIFREMVTQQLRNGPLSRYRRKRVVQFAAHLGINAVLAGRLVQQAQRDHHAARTARQPELRCVASAAPTPTIKPRAIILIIVGLVMINSWMIVRLLG